MATNRLYAQGNRTLPPMGVTAQNKTGSAGLSGEPVVIGQIPGVLLSNADSLGNGVVQRDGIFSLSVKGENSGGNAAITLGAKLYFDSAKAVLNGDTGKVFFGYALQGVSSGATATIPVQVGG